MADTIKFKRGAKAKLPSLNYGEPAFVSDEKELYIGTESGNIKLTSKSEIEELKKKDTELSSQLEQKTDKITMQNLQTQVNNIETSKASKDELNALGRLQLTGQYNTLEELKLAHPTGANGLFLVIADGFTYRWSGSEWIKSAQFQSTGIGDNSITFSKLVNSYDFDSNRITDTINKKRKSGKYYLQYTVEGMPSEIRGLCCIEYICALDRFIYQKVYEYDKPHIFYTRFFDSENYSSTVTEWIKSDINSVNKDIQILFDKVGKILIENSVDFSKLTNSYDFCPTRIEDSVNKKIKSGKYYLQHTVTGMPSDIRGLCCLEVICALDRFVYEKTYVYNQPHIYYTRYFDSENFDTTATEWIKTDNTSIINDINNIKLDLSKITNVNEIDNIHDRIMSLEDRFKFELKPLDKAYVTIVFDDGRHDVDKVINIFKEYNVALNLAVPSQWLNHVVDNGTKVIEFVKEFVKDSKNELLAHSYDHKTITSEITEEEFFHQVRDSKMEYLSYGFDVNGYMLTGGAGTLPNYGQNSKFEKIIRKYYKYGDKVGYNTQYSWERTYMTCGLEQMKKEVDDAIINKKWLRYIGHTIDGTEVNINETNLRAFIEYVKSKGSDKIEFIVYRDMYNRFGSSNIENRILALESK